MSYKIQYNPELKHKFAPCKASSLPVKWTAVMLVALILLGCILEPVKDWILPGDYAITQAAFDNMVEDLDAGEPFIEAFADFCVTIINDEDT